MKKVVFVGLVVNHHSLYSYILDILTDKFDTVCFISQSKIVKEVKIATKVDLIINEKPVYKALKENIDLINSHDVLIMDEYFGAYYHVYKLKFKLKKRILIIHNTNKWSKKIHNPIFNFKNFIDQFLRQHLTKQIDAYITLGPNVQSYFKRHQKNKPVFFLPFVYSNIFPKNINKTSDELRILVPGMIANDRRNYSHLLNKFEEYLTKNIDSNIRMILLGRILSDKDDFVGQQADKINKLFGQKVKYWTSFIDQKEFDKEIENADLILSNIVPKVRKKGITEEYGLSKATGICYIFYNYAKTGIVPKFQKVLEGFDNQFIQFDSYNDLLEIFAKLDNNEYNLISLKESAVQNSIRFNTTIEKEKNNFIKYLIKE